VRCINVVIPSVSHANLASSPSPRLGVSHATATVTQNFRFRSKSFIVDISAAARRTHATHTRGPTQSRGDADPPVRAPALAHRHAGGRGPEARGTDRPTVDSPARNARTQTRHAKSIFPRRCARPGRDATQRVRQSAGGVTRRTDRYCGDGRNDRDAPHRTPRQRRTEPLPSAPLLLALRAGTRSGEEGIQRPNSTPPRASRGRC